MQVISLSINWCSVNARECCDERSPDLRNPTGPPPQFGCAIRWRTSGPWSNSRHSVSARHQRVPHEQVHSRCGDGSCHDARLFRGRRGSAAVGGSRRTGRETHNRMEKPQPFQPHALANPWLEMSRILPSEFPEVAILAASAGAPCGIRTRLSRLLASKLGAPTGLPTSQSEICPRSSTGLRGEWQTFLWGWTSGARHGPSECPQFSSLGRRRPPRARRPTRF